MSKKVNNAPNEVQQNVGEVVNKSEEFIEKHQKQILIGLGIFVLIILGILAFRNFYQLPMQKNAANAMYKAQQYFAVDSFNIALDGDGVDVIGFKQIVSDYGSTKSGNLANAYAGISLYKLGQYQDAIKYLSNFDANDSYFKSSIIGLIGDCYVELGNHDKAQGFYKKVIDQNNEISPIYLKKSAILFETDGQSDDAAKRYEEIKEKHPTSNEAYDIDKYLGRTGS